MVAAPARRHKKSCDVTPQNDCPPNIQDQGGSSAISPPPASLVSPSPYAALTVPPPATPRRVPSVPPSPAGGVPPLRTEAKMKERRKERLPRMLKKINKKKTKKKRGAYSGNRVARKGVPLSKNGVPPPPRHVRLPSVRKGGRNNVGRNNVGRYANNAVRKKLEEIEADIKEMPQLKLNLLPELPREYKGVPQSEKDRQSQYGAQSLRPRSMFSFKSVTVESVTKWVSQNIKRSAQYKKCFNIMLENENKWCGEYAVFYHSYSHAAILYELHAALAKVVFGFEEASPLPRLCMYPFQKVPDAKILKQKHQYIWRTDHHPEFRGAAICGTTSLTAQDSEAPPPRVFENGYHVGAVGGFFKQFLEVAGCSSIMEQIIELGLEHGFPMSMFPEANKYMRSKRRQSYCQKGYGRLLQIFIRRDIVEDYVYCSLPMGNVDSSRPCVKKFVNSNAKARGQVRICVNPRVFMRPDLVKIKVFSADAKFTDKKRKEFQEKLQGLIAGHLDTQGLRNAVVKRLSKPLKNMTGHYYYPKAPYSGYHGHSSSCSELFGIAVGLAIITAPVLLVHYCAPGYSPITAVTTLASASAAGIYAKASALTDAVTTGGLVAARVLGATKGWDPSVSFTSLFEGFSSHQQTTSSGDANVLSYALFGLMACGAAERGAGAAVGVLRRSVGGLGFLGGVAIITFICTCLLG